MTQKKLETSMILRLRDAGDDETLIDILRDAETSEERLRQQISLPEHTSYFAWMNGEVVGGATLKWQKDESELIYLATTPQNRGKGYGKAIIKAILQEMPKWASHSLLVGTGNSSLSNIAFYQKCGFRIDHVRHDYFAYAQPPIWEDGILLQDMLMFRYVNNER